MSPMDLISLDLHNYGGRTYLSAQDKCSGFRWCERLKSQASAEVIKFLQRLQQNYGKITCVRADGGPQFRTEFKEYLENAGIAFSPSSPYNPVSNSAAESSVRLNKLLQKKTGCMDWMTTSPVGEDELMKQRKPLRRTVRFISEAGG